ncbi:hypothetical protein WOLCODRAFT_83055 [Wolfiporia cocos MD-104 SS10]|uniref:Condensation domain-containing protein n=1 Tax=Wolfiporia cocos (strain MD-104) TaxID=742152 RepID=A0A2H3J407_WOLCO|nr:hypothetical protein WOLCODRAFT_83055 [Wolfiporia cocos MD-104 SS10]
MADSSASPELSLSTSDLVESIVTSSRPLGEAERGHILTRGIHGFSDCYVIVILDGPVERLIPNDHVVLACAALRIRHPLLSSHVSFAGLNPEYVCAAPMSEQHALKETKDMIEFSSFQTRDQPVAALRKRWSEGTDPRDVLDIRQGTIRFAWMSGIGAAEGQYVFGLQIPHFATDGHRQILIVRQFLELLADIDRAHGELMGHFSGPRRPLRLPDNLEAILPDIQTSEAQMTEAQAAYDKLTQASTLPRAGRIPDGTGARDRTIPREVLRVWPREDTRRILSACKAHGVSITQVIAAAMALAIMEAHANLELPSSISLNEPQGFILNHAIDLTPRAQPSAKAAEPELALRIVTFPVFLAAPPSAYAVAHEMETLWSLAKQCRENTLAFVQSPNFWQFMYLARDTLAEDFFSRVAGEPSVPYLSSVGDLDSELPMHYQFISSSATAPQGSQEDHTQSLAISKLILGIKANPFVDTVSLWTFDRQLHINIFHSASRMTPALMDPYIRRIHDIISRLSVVAHKL